MVAAISLTTENVPLKEEPLVFPLPPSIPHAMLSVVPGDGRCLLNSLLRSVEKETTAAAADGLRSVLRDSMARYTTTESWEARVPSIAQDMGGEKINTLLSPADYAVKFLSNPTTHLPSSVICVWQDVLHPTLNVYVLVHDSTGDYVETFPAPLQPASKCIVLQRVFEGTVGHYGVVTVGGSCQFNVDHPLIAHISSLQHPVLLPTQDRREKRKAEAAVEVDEEEVVVDKVDEKEAPPRRSTRLDEKKEAPPRRSTRRATMYYRDHHRPCWRLRQEVIRRLMKRPPSPSDEARLPIAAFLHIFIDDDGVEWVVVH
jgi:hypothetical protein